MKRSPEYYVFPDPDSLAGALACEFEKYITRLSGNQADINIALSGGNTPVPVYRAIINLNPDINWGKVNFFWGDERCVHPDSSESNFGNALQEFLGPLGIDPSKIFRIRGEDDPDSEAIRYERIVREVVAPSGGIPSFDWVFLGLGEDGHTLSIFPDQIGLWDAPELCITTVHPATGRRRISFTGKILGAAKRITFIVTGENKQEVVRKIIYRQDDFHNYPASLVKAQEGTVVEWYLDRESASSLT